MIRSLWISATLLALSYLAEAAGLQTTFGDSGLTSITYNNATLMDSRNAGSDAFTIWEYRLINPDGSVSPQFGESTSGRSWDANLKTLTWNYYWGNVKVAYLQVGDTLNLAVTVSNTGTLTVEGLNIYPFYLHFPGLPKGFGDLNYPRINFNTDGPGISLADYGAGSLAVVNEDPTKPLYTGFSSTGSTAYHLLIGSTYNSAQASFWPKYTRPIPPGSSDTYRVSFRFAPSGATPSSVAPDVYTTYRAVWPYLVNWPDRRPIGDLFIASSGAGDSHRKAGFPTNPRRYWNDPAVNITSSPGLSAFQQRVLAYADNSVSVIKRTGGQGMITWDIEGQEYPHATSYVCAPEKLAQLAPEMEAVADAYFKKFRDAGLKVGVCVRPQEFTIHSDGTADQVALPDSAVAAQLIRKVGYVKQRWGVTIVYIDSAVNANGGTLDASIFRTLQQAYPDTLIIPEERTDAHYAYSAPYMSVAIHHERQTADTTKALYPQAFSSVYIADAPQDPATDNVLNYSQFVAGVKGGDILMFRGYFDDSYYNGQVKKIYAEAGVLASPIVPPPVSTPPPVVVVPPAVTPPPVLIPISSTFFCSGTPPAITCTSPTTPSATATVSGPISFTLACSGMPSSITCNTK